MIDGRLDGSFEVPNGVERRVLENVNKGFRTDKKQKKNENKPSGLREGEA